MYRFVKDDNQGNQKRLFVQGTTPKLGPPIVTNLSNPEEMENLQAVYTNKRLSTEVLGSSFESTKTSKRNEDGYRRITTRIVRKVTTLTRGEEQARQENLMKQSQIKCITSSQDVAPSIQEVCAKRVKVSFVSPEG